MKVETKMEVEVESILISMETDHGTIQAQRLFDDEGATYAQDGVTLPPDVAKRLLRSAARRLMEEVIGE